MSEAPSGVRISEALSSDPGQKEKGFNNFRKQIPLFLKRERQPVQDLRTIHHIINGPRTQNAPGRTLEDGTLRVLPKGHFRKVRDNKSTPYDELSIVMVTSEKIAYAYNAPRKKVDRFMNMLEVQYQEALANAKTVEEKLRALAFFNVWVTLIQPFPDGNTLALSGFNTLEFARMGYNLKKRPSLKDIGVHTAFSDDPFKAVYVERMFDVAKKDLKPTKIEELIEEGIARGLERPRPEDETLYGALALVFEVVLDKYCGLGTGAYRLLKQHGKQG